MLKYLICDKTETDPKIIQRDCRWIDNMFDFINKEGLDSKLIDAQPGDIISLVSDSFRDGTIMTQSFSCTERYQGEFFVVVMNSGYVIKHDCSLEFSFE